MNNALLGCFALVQGAALTRVLAEIAGPGDRFAGALTISLALWLAGMRAWIGR